MKEVKITETTENGYEVYGIEIVTDEGNILSYSDLSADSEAIRVLAQNLKAEDLSPDHIKDIIRDFIVGETYDKLALNNIV